MTTVQEFTSYAFAFLSLLFASIGTLTPEMVKRAGNVFATWLHSESRWSILERARMQSGHRAQKKDWLEDIGYQCRIQLAVFAFTSLLSYVLSFCFAIFGGMWAARALQLLPVGSPLRATLLGVSSILLMLAAVSIYDIFRTSFGKQQSSISFSHGLIRHIKLPLVFVPPFGLPMFFLVSVFTMHIPRAWYETIKIVHRNGINWLLILLSFVTGALAIAIPAYAKVNSLIQRQGGRAGGPSRVSPSVICRVKIGWPPGARRESGSAAFRGGRAEGPS